MAVSLNKVTLIGNLGKDPESRSFQNGGKVVNFSIATSENWKDKNTGERKEKVEWHNVAIFNEVLAGVAEKYLRKGSKCYVEGKLQTRKWQDQSGNDRYSTEVVLTGFDGVLIPFDGKDQSQGGGGSGAQGGRQQSRSEAFGSGGRSGFSDDLDDDVPFITIGGAFAG